jgi:DNA-binding IclR family transcriptional regulator
MVDRSVLQCEPGMPIKPKTSGVLVLHKTLDILETIKNERSGLRLTELARLVDLPKPTVYRILTTLEGRGYLDRVAGGGYRIARKLSDFQRSAPLEQVLNKVAQPVMEELARSTKETVNLGLLDGYEVVVINTVESPLSIRMSSTIGKRRDVHATALGKVLLAGGSDKDVSRLIRLRKLPRLTEYTITDPDAFFAEVRKVHKRGYAFDNQENEIDGRCIGAPILGPDDSVIAALSISGPVFRMTVKRAESFAPVLRQACARISKGVREYRAPSAVHVVRDEE